MAAHVIAPWDGCLLPTIPTDGEREREAKMLLMAEDDQEQNRSRICMS